MSIMLVALLILGAFLFWQGKITFGPVQTEGRHVKAAGVLLMLPAASFLLLSIVMGMLFGVKSNSIQFVIAFLAVFQLVMMVLCTVLAYILIVDPPNAPQLPGILGDIQRERRGGKSAPPSSSSSRPKQPTQEQQRPSRQRHPLERYMPQEPLKLPNVMTVKEAAVYMGVTQDEIMRLIDAGKLPAARDNAGFRIARSVLDELKTPTMTPQG